MRLESSDVPSVERVLALRACRAFEALDPAQLAPIAECLKVHGFPKGAELVRPGVPLTSMAFVIRGQVHVYRGAESARRVGPGEVIGELADLFNDEPAPTVVAVEETLTLQLDRSDIEDLLEDEFPLFIGVLRGLARELARSPRTVFNMAPLELSPSMRGKVGWVDRIQLLRRTMDFAGTEIEALAELAKQATDVLVPMGTRLWTAGDSSDYFLVLTSGRVEAFVGDRRLVFGPGSAMGALEALSGDARSFTATAQTEVRALHIATHSLLDLMEDNVTFGISLLRAMARGIGETPARAA